MQAGLRLPHRGKRLIQIGRHLREIVARFGLGRQAQRDADLVDALQRLFDLGLGHQQRFLAAVELLLATRRRIATSGTARS